MSHSNHKFTSRYTFSVSIGIWTPLTQHDRALCYPCRKLTALVIASVSRAYCRISWRQRSSVSTFKSPANTQRSALPEVTRMNWARSNACISRWARYSSLLQSYWAWSWNRESNKPPFRSHNMHVSPNLLFLSRVNQAKCHSPGFSRSNRDVWQANGIIEPLRGSLYFTVLAHDEFYLIPQSWVAISYPHPAVCSARISAECLF